ncbi:MAG: hypothetical protein SFY81_02005 [Verrucomicrobiota bacterium]|nr:hypothetical protein [Verrucomicrobiota bacterium]
MVRGTHRHGYLPRICLLLLISGGLAGCSREEISSYRVPKEQKKSLPRHAHGPGDGHNHEAPAPERPHLHWELPTGWSETSGDTMRAGSFRISAGDGRLAEVSIVPLQGVTGVELESVNMWRQSLGLKEVGREEFAGMTSKVQVGPATGTLVEMASTEARVEGKFKLRTIGVFLEQEGALWFFKMTGEDALVAEQKPKFLTFLKSVTFHGPDAHGEQKPAVTAREPASTTQGDWPIPQGWQATEPGQMVKASYKISGGSGQSADVTVSVFPGATGGLLANVNRWRGQINLPPIQEGELANLVSEQQLPRDKAQIVDLLGTRAGKETRMLGAIVPRGENTWFFKMTGDSELVGQQKENLLGFIDKAR